ncbi:RNA 2',3'-cyclic phosphodiesterase [Orrella sp. JC864]|uniref:RNA 2',3'-cyclic phosphodiesterase n=1 Tax=Orrella sp. JC864 TaxID=3120298 RepID=UPI0012BD4281
MPSPWNRCFIALAPDARTRERLADLPIARPARRVAFDDLHLTVAFLGPVRPDQGHALAHALPELAAPLPELAFLNLALWPSAARPQVQVAQYDYPEALRALVAHVQTVLRRLQLPVETRKFRPHVTLARLRRDAGGCDAQSLQMIETWRDGPPAGFESIGLYSSVGEPGTGARYRLLADAALPGG